MPSIEEVTSHGPQLISSASSARLHPELWRTTHYHPGNDGLARWLPTHHVHFVIEGSSTWSGHGARVELKPGGIYVAFGSSGIRRETQHNLLSYRLVFSYELIGGLDLFSDWKQPAQIGEWNPDEYRKAWEPDNLTREQAWLITSITEAALIRHGGSRLSEVVERHAAMEGRFGPIFAHINDHLSASLRIEELAEIMGMNRSAFARAFRTVTGSSPKAFLSEQINRKASQALLATDRRIKDIAADLGFRDAFHFNRFFKQLNGVPPSQFRQKKGENWGQTAKKMRKRKS